jgi:hypothetical protein
MTMPLQNGHPLDSLLDVKRNLGLSGAPPVASPPAEESEEAWPSCVNCGYAQRETAIDRCPECGLRWASRLSDPTPWTAEGQTNLAWWRTAWRIWSWDRRIRVRTGLIPATPESGRFAKSAVLWSTPLLALALALASSSSARAGWVRAWTFLASLACGTLLVLLIQTGTLYGLRLALRGTWRNTLRFVPASIDYATAWWLPTSLLLLLFACFGLMQPDSMFRLCLLIAAFWGLLTWCTWLWGSATESGHVPYVAPRVLGVTAVSTLASVAILLLIPGAVRQGMIQTLTQTGATMASIRAFGTFGSAPASQAPRTHALIVDVIADRDDDLVMRRISLFGPTADTQVALRGQECKLKDLELALDAIAEKVRALDRLVLYFNGEGSPHGAGSIRLADGEITSQKLNSFLSRLPTKQVLLIIDSGYGAKFIEALDARNVVVLTSTDQQDAAFTGGLHAFWEALAQADADTDADGKVTVSEAFWHAYRKMLEENERKRQSALIRWPEKALDLDDSGYAAPQLEALGLANEDDFAVKLPAKATPEDTSAP